MSNLLKYTVPTWNDHVYGYSDSVLAIRTSDSVIRIFGMLDTGSANEELMSRILNNGSVTISIPDLNRFAGGANLNLEAVYNGGTVMEARNTAPHIVLGIYSKETYCAGIDSWTNPETITLTRIDSIVQNNRLGYLTKTPRDSSLLALSMLNNTMHGGMGRNNKEYHSLNMPSRDTLVTYRCNLNPVPVSNQGNPFDNGRRASILISPNNHPSYNLFEAQVSDPLLSRTGLSGVLRTSSTNEACTLAADRGDTEDKYAQIGDLPSEYRITSYHPVSRMMDTNYKGVYTTPEKDTVFINGGGYKPTSLLKYTNKLLRKD